MNKLKTFFDIKFFKFILVGLLNTAVGEGVILLLLHLAGWKHFSWGAGMAAFVGTVVGSVVSYFLNKYFTFKNTEKGWKPVFRFALNIAVCYVIAYVVVSPLVTWICTANGLTMFGWSVKKFAGNAALLVGACTFVACNYVGQRFFAFKEKK